MTINITLFKSSFPQQLKNILLFSVHFWIMSSLSFCKAPVGHEIIVDERGPVFLMLRLCREGVVRHQVQTLNNSVRPRLCGII